MFSVLSKTTLFWSHASCFVILFNLLAICWKRSRMWRSKNWSQLASGILCRCLTRQSSPRLYVVIPPRSTRSSNLSTSKWFSTVFKTLSWVKHWNASVPLFSFDSSRANHYSSYLAYCSYFIMALIMYSNVWGAEGAGGGTPWVTVSIVYVQSTKSTFVYSKCSFFSCWLWKFDE